VKTRGASSSGVVDRRSPGSRVGHVATGRCPQRGYTLIEVLVAFAVLAGALTLLLGILTGASRQVRWAAEAGRAALHAQSLLDQTGIGEPLQPGQRQGGFEDGHYQWTLVVEPWRDPAVRELQPVEPGAPQMMQLDLQVRWGDGGRGERMHLRSLRLVTSDPLQDGALP
jgi:general secretion pathway protein I